MANMKHFLFSVLVPAALYLSLLPESQPGVDKQAKNDSNGY